MPRPVALLDANVLYPARLRDLLIRLDIAGRYQARWTERILDECFDNIVEDRPDLTPAQLARTRRHHEGPTPIVGDDREPDPVLIVAAHRVAQRDTQQVARREACQCVRARSALCSEADVLEAPVRGEYQVSPASGMGPL
jgi:hypothetical protein